MTFLCFNLIKGKKELQWPVTDIIIFFFLLQMVYLLVFEKILNNNLDLIVSINLIMSTGK